MLQFAKILVTCIGIAGEDGACTVTIAPTDEYVMLITCTRELRARQIENESRYPDLIVSVSKGYCVKMDVALKTAKAEAFDLVEDGYVVGRQGW